RLAAVGPVLEMHDGGNHGTFAIGDVLYYLTGGRADAANGVRGAQVLANGALGAFQLLSIAGLTPGRQWAARGFTGTQLYLIGGVIGYPTPSTTSTIRRAAVDVEGVLGDFADVGISTAELRTAPAAAVLDSTVYVLTGAYSGAPTIEQAAISAD